MQKFAMPAYNYFALLQTIAMQGNKILADERVN
jgi:hypothetical protein